MPAHPDLDTLHGKLESRYKIYKLRDALNELDMYDAIYIDDTATHTTGVTKGMGIMAVAVPTDTAIEANDIGMPAMSLDRRLHVDADITASVTLTVDTELSTAAAASPLKRVVPPLPSSAAIEPMATYFQKSAGTYFIVAASR